jgi:hypothetical protein
VTGSKSPTKVFDSIPAIQSRPAAQRGIAVPVKIPDLSEDADGAANFAQGARTILQR